MKKIAETEIIKEKFTDNFIRDENFRGQTTIVVERSVVFDVLKFLKGEREYLYEYLVDIAGVDYLYIDEIDRFGVVYLLYSYLMNRRIRVKTLVPDDNPVIKSVTPLWKSANWIEREIYDQFGIKFEGHPDLRRILNPDYFKYHPLRKDYPLKGRGEREDFPILK